MKKRKKKKTRKIEGNTIKETIEEEDTNDKKRYDKRHTKEAMDTRAEREEKRRVRPGCK